MKLYAYRYCPYSRRVRIALAEEEVEHDYVELAPDAPHPPELRGKTPSDKGVPIFMVRDDFVLWDSTAIIHWVDSAYPRSLLPSQREPAAYARAWQGWAVSKLMSDVDELYGGDARAKAAAEQRIVEKLREIEHMIGDQWLVGDEFSVADIALAPAIAALSSKALESLPPKVRAYAGRLRSRPSVRNVCELDAPEATERPSFAA